MAQISENPPSRKEHTILQLPKLAALPSVNVTSISVNAAYKEGSTRDPITQRKIGRCVKD